QPRTMPRAEGNMYLTTYAFQDIIRRFPVIRLALMAKKIRHAVSAHSPDPNEGAVLAGETFSGGNGAFHPEDAAACLDLAARQEARISASGDSAGLGSLAPATLKELRKRSGHTQEELA